MLDSFEFSYIDVSRATSLAYVAALRPPGFSFYGLYVDYLIILISTSNMVLRTSVLGKSLCVTITIEFLPAISQGGVCEWPGLRYPTLRGAETIPRMKTTSGDDQMISH